ncbi:hypothetical protein PtB15_5B474 [Puccinia triticina]|nr:hypothetical protein PtB15_5B474 [Puccinia triticina]
MTETSVSKKMIKWAIGIPLKSIVVVEGHLQAPVEDLPFLLEDASQPVDLLPKEGKQFVTVGTNTCLDNRVLDLRTPVNQATFGVQLRVCNLFRRFLDDEEFIKIQGAATESGASVFKLGYFEQTAFLAQSPQLAIAANFDRVYEISPVFWAENSNTYSKFIGLNLEMAINKHYHEAVDLLDRLFLSIFRGLQASSAPEIQTIKSQNPLDDFTFLKQTLRLSHKEAVQILINNGIDIQLGQDMGTEQEHILGKLIKEKVRPYYYISNKFPLAIQPFYTMPDPVNPTLSNSYYFFMRGEDIISGADPQPGAPEGPDERSGD